MLGHGNRLLGGVIPEHREASPLVGSTGHV